MGVVTRCRYPEKKYGFVERDNVNVFFHFANLAPDQRPEDINVGDTVSFVVEVKLVLDSSPHIFTAYYIHSVVEMHHR